MRSPVRVALAVLVAGVLGAGVLTSAGASPSEVTDTSASAASPGHRSGDPIILGHRGAAGYRPEHTSEGNELAAAFGADYFEPDLVPTKDGVLVDRHEPDISQTTDVASHPEFASRKRTVMIDGITTTGWFTFDFTLAELKTLRAIERLPDIRQHNTLYNGRDTVPTFQEDLDQRSALSREFHRTLGIVPEIKHSTFFASIGLPMEQRVLDVLRLNHFDHVGAPVIIQSFEVGNLQWLHRRTPVPLMQLTGATGAPADLIANGDPRTYADITTPVGLREVARYAIYLGPDKNQIVPRDVNQKLMSPTPLVRDAHSAGLLVTPYTFRNENTFLPLDYRSGTNPGDYGNAFAEYALFFALGVDGMFSDNSDTAVAARDQWIHAGRPVRAAA